MEEEKQISFREIILRYPDGQNPCGQNPNDGGNRMGTNNYGGGSVVPYNMHSELYPMHGNANFDFFPPGYRFKPSDEELVVHYLRKKILNESLPPNRIEEVELYKRNPQDLAENYTSSGDNELYFFTPRDRKYKNGQRPNRSAGDGYWKATGVDKPIHHKGVKVGSRKSLVFYHGKPPNGDKTCWIMHEFTVANLPRRKKSQVENDMRLDDWVLCRLYKNSKGPGRARDSQVPDQEPESEVPLIQDREKEPKVEESNMLPQENFLAPFEQMYNQANPMGLYYYDNSPFLHGYKSGLSDGSESLCTQPWQNPTTHHMVSGHHQNPMLPPELFYSADSITQEQLNDYHSGDFSNNLPFSDCPGASTSVISPPNDDKKLKTHL